MKEMMKRVYLKLWRKKWNPKRLRIDDFEYINEKTLIRKDSETIKIIKTT